MSVKNCEKLENSKVVLTIEVGAEEFEAAINKAYLKMRGKINVDGFRRGKAPRKMIEKLYGVEVFYEEAVNIVLPDAYEGAVKEQALDVVGYPEVELVECGKDGVTFNGIIAANDQMALGAMEALKGANIELGTGEGQVMISGIDGTAEALQAVKDGQMAQTVLQDAPGQGAAAVDVIKTYMAGEKPDAEVLVPYVYVTAENVDEYLK